MQTTDPNELWLTQCITSQVVTHQETSEVWQMWKLIPVNVERGFTPPPGTPEPRPLPPYEGGIRTQRVEDDEFGTIVNEVTVVTTTSTVTTRKRYRVEET